MTVDLAPRVLPFPSAFYESAETDGQHDGAWSTGRSSLIMDHQFVSISRYDLRCRSCKMAEAAHARSLDAVPF